MARFLDVGRVATCHSARGHLARGVRHPACPGPTCPWPTCPSGATPCPCPACPWPPCPSGATLADLHMATCPWGAAMRWSNVLILGRPFRVCPKICALDQPLQDVESRFKKNSQIFFRIRLSIALLSIQ